MAHTIGSKKKLINRIRRIRGQVDAIEKAVAAERECSEVLHTIVACRGAMNGLMAELLEGHVRFHVLDPARKSSAEQLEGAQDLIDVIKTYLK
ncbi:MAG: metal/formaldehyde-sensitive transcriptional repressor [Nitrospirae bacterium]|nr:metal/formaldehyde-sensitive transcriptional repressor [Nitrospirota bacterium]